MPSSSPDPGSFGALLRAWRRTRQLSQEALALDAQVSQRHLFFLESGRAAPSREMVLHLGHALDVPLRERNLLLSAAGFAPAYARRALDEPELAAVSSAVDLMLDGIAPCPAVAVDRDWRLVRANVAALAGFSAFVDLDRAFARSAGDDGNPNVLRLVFHPEGLRPFIEDWPSVGPALLARTRRELAADPAWDGGGALYRDLEALAGFAAGAESWTPSPDPVLTFTLKRDDLRLALFSTVATFGTAQDVTVQELRIETFFPADASTRDALDGLTRAAGSA